MNSEKLLDEIAYLMFREMRLTLLEEFDEDNRENKLVEEANNIFYKVYLLCKQLYINYEEDTTDLQIDNYIDAIIDRIKVMEDKTTDKLVYFDYRDYNYARENLKDSFNA